MKIWSLHRISYFMIYTLCKTFHLFQTIHHLKRFNPLWPSDSIWQHRFGSTLVQVMACCLMAPSHYLNQCWPVINKVFWHSPHCNFTGNALNINNWCELEYYQFKKHNHTFLWTMSFYPTLAREVQGFGVWRKFVFRTLELTATPTISANRVKVGQALDQSRSVQLRRPERVHEDNALA